MMFTCQPWTSEEESRLSQLWSEGFSVSQIAQLLDRSRNSICGKRMRMDLPERPSPIPVRLDTRRAAIVRAQTLSAERAAREAIAKAAMLQERLAA